MNKFLVIQTAFIGDVVLATALVEKLHQHYPSAQIDFLLRSGNEGLLQHHPFINEVLVWQKRSAKYKHLFSLLKKIRATKYDAVINVQRFAATGFLTAFSKAKQKIGFDKNPFGFLFTKKIKHLQSSASKPLHEVERNNSLIESLTNKHFAKPKLYPSQNDFDKIKQYAQQPFICIAACSVWFTKQYPSEKWISFISKIPAHIQVLLIGAPTDKNVGDEIKNAIKNVSVINLCGQLNFLESAALQSKALMNYANDSAPMHFASAMNAPIAAVYCSTLPSYGYGPLSDESFIIEIEEKLYCRSCGIHGRKDCPEKHFRCAMDIDDEQLLAVLQQQKSS